MKTSTRLIAILFLFVIAACGKKEIVPPSPTFVLILDTPALSGNKVVLKWSGIDPKYIGELRIERGSDTNSGKQLRTIVCAPTDTQYVDTLMLSSYVDYRVSAQVRMIEGYKTVYSNLRVFIRPDLDFLTFVPKETICDKATGRIYLAGEAGELAIYDMATRKILHKIETGANIMGMNMATHDGRKEVYLSRNDGWVFIYDAETLEKTDQLNTVIVPYSMVYNNGKLFISGTSSTPSFVTYDRSTKVRLFDTAYTFSNINLLLLPGTNTELLGIYSNHYRIGFDAGGRMKSVKVNYSGSYYAYPPFILLPGNDRVVCATSGYIFDTGFNYISTLPHGSFYLRSFDLDADNSKLYCATTGKEVHVYHTTTYGQEKRMATLGYPKNAFYYNGIVYCISTEYDSYGYSTNAFIERL